MVDSGRAYCHWLSSKPILCQSHYPVGLKDDLFVTDFWGHYFIVHACCNDHACCNHQLFN